MKKTISMLLLVCVLFATIFAQTIIQAIDQTSVEMSESSDWAE